MSAAKMITTSATTKMAASTDAETVYSHWPSYKLMAWLA
jgi:hypothetical protein